MRLDAEPSFEDIEQAIAASEAEADKKDPAGAKVRADERRANRGELRRRSAARNVTIAPEDVPPLLSCGPMHVIGEESSRSGST